MAVGSGPQWRLKKIAVALTVGTDAYTANDVVGGLITFPGAGWVGGGGYVCGMSLVDDADQSEPYVLHLFDATPSTIADDAAFAPTEADLKKKVGKITLLAGDYDTDGADCVGQVHLSGSQMILYTSADNQLYGYLVATSTPDYAAADDLTITLWVWQY